MIDKTTIFGSLGAVIASFKISIKGVEDGGVYWPNAGGG